MLNIAIVVGSLRKESINLKLAHAMKALAAGKMNFHFLDVASIPLYNQDHEDNLPASVAKAKELVTKADGVLFFTPEYNRSLPGVLKNVVDWVSRPWGQNTWNKKPAGIVGISVGSIGTAAAQSHLRSILTILGMPVMGTPELYLHLTQDFFTSTGEIANEDTKKILQGYIDNLALWIAKTK